ncbi:hypothetical protein [Photobacterium carnosum]|uniref:Type 4 fimbrial biogenesis protein PilX N-terminal domain-containing protein n=1 Tax=Photobacterium carnosum TaxID=2023717 RepID=A0A2N4UTU5_9GAMM|nr:hypothetical protein [Photobacterium carnosum]PLC58440.1 hypothetical protein CIK00_07005 [Photobacterium carnosum]
MNKHQQSGMTTLLITSMLLIVALLFSLASYKNLFYQIKRTQNEVLARQAHWAAEGGLECGFAEYKIKKNNFTDFDECNTTKLTLKLIPVTSTEFQLESKVKFFNSLKKITKTIILGGGGVISTLETSASVELKGSQHFVPNSTEEKNNDGDFYCKTITSGGVVSFQYTSGNDDHFLTTDLSTSSHAGGPLAAVGFNCASDYRSNLFDVNHPPSYGTSSVKGKDIVENATLDIFKSIFGKDISEYSQVMTEIESDPKGIIIGKGASERTSGGWVKNCNTLIKNSYVAGKRRIWVHGSCALDGNPFGSVIENTADNAVQLVFFDGLVLLEAVSHINGLIYQYVSDSFNVRDGWIDLFNNLTLIGVTPGGFQEHNVTAGEYDKSVINVRGSVYIDGGIGIDAPNKIVNIDGSIIPSYNKGKSSKYIDSLFWQEGSWHDF